MFRDLVAALSGSLTLRRPSELRRSVDPLRYGDRAAESVRRQRAIVFIDLVAAPSGSLTLRRPSELRRSVVPLSQGDGAAESLRRQRAIVFGPVRQNPSIH